MVIDIINANVAGIENLRPKVDKTAVFIDKLKKILKNKNIKLLFDYADEIYAEIQKYNENQEIDKNKSYEFADYQYILINILNLFPYQCTSNYQNAFDKELSKKAIEKIKTFKNHED